MRLILAAIAVSCVVSSCRSSSQPAPAPVSADTWAVVNGTAITRDDVDKAFRRLGDSAEIPSEEEALTVKLGLLDDLILEEILIGKARTLKIEITESEVDAAYAEMRKDVADEAFQKEMSRRNLTTEDVRNGIRRQLLARKLIEQEVSSKITVTDQQVSDFFNANRAQFNLPEEAFRLAQIVVTPGPDPQVGNRTGDDARTPQAAATKVQMLMERLQKGAAFPDLARDYSEDPESAPRGGDLGMVPLSAVKQAPAPLRDAVLELTPGRAKVVNQNGIFSIVFVVAREPAGQRDLSMPAVKQQITDALKGRKEQLIRNAYLSTARSDAEVTNYMARRVVEAQGLPK